MAASSFEWFPPYFYFRFGRKWTSESVFRHFRTSNVRRSLVDQLRVDMKIGRRPPLLLPVSPKPEVVL